MNQPRDDIGRYAGYRNVTYRKKQYKIPVDVNGHVPQTAMVQHLQAHGGHGKDLKTSAVKTYPQNATPEQMVRWWANPGRYDINGIDTKNAKPYRPTGLVTKKSKEAQKNIPVVGSTIDRIHNRRALAKGFTSDELKNMSKGSSYVIAIDRKNDKSVSGKFSPDGETPIVFVEPRAKKETIIHENVHHARMSEDRTGIAKSRLSKGNKPTKNDIKMEERATIAETTARSRGVSGYYEGLRTDKNKAWSNDRKTMTGSRSWIPTIFTRSKKGKAATDSVNQNYRRTEISKAAILDGDNRSKGPPRTIRHSNARKHGNASGGTKHGKRK